VGIGCSSYETEIVQEQVSTKNFEGQEYEALEIKDWLIAHPQ